MVAVDHQHLLALPFGNPIVAPHYLYNLGFLLAGLQLARTMRVLDFGAGTCWLSRHLNEMGCLTISLDPSAAALDLGRKLFELLSVLTERTDFMLHKGPLVMDSRMSFAARGGPPDSPDLSHTTRADQTRHPVRAGEPVRVCVQVRNSGSVRWLHSNLNHFAMVKVGGHLYDQDMRLLDHDFLRVQLEHDVSPGQEVAVEDSFAGDRPGRYYVLLELVSERVAWFAQAGSEPLRLEVQVS
jgi:hypothetical protein